MSKTRKPAPGSIEALAGRWPHHVDYLQIPCGARQELRRRGEDILAGLEREPRAAVDIDIDSCRLVVAFDSERKLQ